MLINLFLFVFFCVHQSLVLISKLPYVTFFHSLLKLIAPEYFEKQEPCLEAGEYGMFERLAESNTCLNRTLGLPGHHKAHN